MKIRANHSSLVASNLTLPLSFILVFMLLVLINIIQIITLPNPTSDLGVAAGFPLACYIKGGYVGTEEFIPRGVALNLLFAFITSLAFAYIVSKLVRKMAAHT